MKTGGPYRESDPAPRYVCIVCYRSASATGGTCARCGGPPLQSLDNPEVLDELRRRSMAKKARIDRLQFIVTAVSAAVCALVLDVVLLATHTYDTKLPSHAGYSGRWGAGGELFLYPFLLWLGFVVLLTYVFKWTRVFRRSTEQAEKLNAETAGATEMLAWLGVKTDSR